MTIKSTRTPSFIHVTWIIAIMIGISIPIDSKAQASEHIGLELQVYPAGVILGIRGGLIFDRQQELNLRLGYNIARRGDFGEHDNEEGGGPGFSLGYRYHFMDNLKDLFIGARADIWFMDIDWRDDQPLRTGTTNITVFQPTLETGYDLLKRSDWTVAPTVSFGYEINIKTEGDDVGEGAILLGGVNATYSF